MTQGIMAQLQLRVELAQTGEKCRVWLCGVEISRYLRGFQITARIGEPTGVTFETLMVPGVVDGTIAVAGIIDMLGAMAPEEAPAASKPELPATSSDGKP